MADSSPGRLQIWEGGFAPASGAKPVPARGGPIDLAARLFAAEAMAGGRGRTSAEPYTLPWFLDLEATRHNRHGRWLPRLLEFERHRGETLLALGEGLGTDWVQYARHGTEVIVCSPQADRLTLVQRNFEVRGLTARYLHAGASALPLPSGAIDVVCLHGLLPGQAAPEAIVEEVYRVLKPGGKVLALVPARYDIRYWRRTCLPWRRPSPDSASHSGGSLRRLFARFTEHNVYKRHLRRSEVPHVARWLPLPLLERVAGRLLLLKAFKPLSSALPPAVAA